VQTLSEVTVEQKYKAISEIGKKRQNIGVVVLELAAVVIA
jgi:hypothetical protein